MDKYLEQRKRKKAVIEITMMSFVELLDRLRCGVHVANSPTCWSKPVSAALTLNLPQKCMTVLNELHIFTLNWKCQQNITE